MSDRRDDPLREAMHAMKRALDQFASSSSPTATEKHTTGTRPDALVIPAPAVNVDATQKGDSRLFDVLGRLASSLMGMGKGDKAATVNVRPSPVVVVNQSGLPVFDQGKGMPVFSRTTAAPMPVVVQSPTKTPLPFPQQSPQMLPKTAPMPFQDKLPTVLPKVPPQPTPVTQAPAPPKPQQPTPVPQQAPKQPAMEKSWWQEMFAEFGRASREALKESETPKPTLKERIFGAAATPGVTEKEKEAKVKTAQDELTKAESLMEKTTREVTRRETVVAKAQEAVDKAPTDAKREKAQDRLKKAQEGLAEAKERMQGTPGAVAKAKEALTAAQGMAVGKEGAVGAVGKIIGSFRETGAGGMDGLNRARGGVGQAAGAVGKDNIGALGAGAVNAIGGTAGMVVGTLGGGPVGAAVVGGLTQVGTAAFNAVGKLQEWADTLHDSNMRFAEFSASMAQVSAEMDVRQTYESMRRGERRAPAAEKLANAKQDLAENLSPFYDLLDNLVSLGMVEVIKLLNLGLGTLRDIAEKVGIISKKGDEDGENIIHVPDWIEEAIKGPTDPDKFSW